MNDELVPHRGRVVLCTLRYSDNLGDGVIGDCMEFLIKKQRPGFDVEHLDMAGRTGFSAPKESRLGYLRKILFYACPVPMRGTAFRLLWPLLFEKRMAHACGHAFRENVDALVFGGGQMLNDVALNFPLKFQYVAKYASQRRTSMAMAGVGVSSNWSKRGLDCFRGALSSPLFKYVSVRDERSRNTLTSYLESRTSEVAVTLDPAIWSSEAYKVVPREKSVDVLRVGFGIANPEELATQAQGENFSAASFDSFWLDVIDGVKSLNCKIVLFSNGAVEDDTYLRQFAAKLKSVRPDVLFEVLPRAERPHELVSQIAGMDVIVAHRLHANIIAYSCSVPSIALVWDAKVAGFCDMVGRSRWCYHSLTDGARVAADVEQAYKTGVDLDQQQKLKSICLSKIEDMLGAVGK